MHDFTTIGLTITQLKDMAHLLDRGLGRRQDLREQHTIDEINAFIQQLTMTRTMLRNAQEKLAAHIRGQQ